MTERAFPDVDPRELAGPMPDYDTYKVAVLSEEATAFHRIPAVCVRCPQCGATRFGKEPAEADRALRFELDAGGVWALRCACGVMFYPDIASSPVLPTTIAWIAPRFGIHEPVVTRAGDGHTDGDGPAEPNTVIYRGHAFGHSFNGNPSWSYTPPPGWQHAHGWDDGGFRSVWFSLAERGILTYCEGDLDLRLYPDRAAFVRAMRHAAAFYGAPPLKEYR